MQFRFHCAPVFLRIYFGGTDVKSISSRALRDEALAVLTRERSHAPAYGNEGLENPLPAKPHVMGWDQNPG